MKYKVTIVVEVRMDGPTEAIKRVEDALRGGNGNRTPPWLTRVVDVGAKLIENG